MSAPSVPKIPLDVPSNGIGIEPMTVDYTDVEIIAAQTDLLQTKQLILQKQNK